MTLTGEQQAFIERVGLYFEEYHLSRIGGRLLGLLLLSDHPLGIEEMATTLGVSRASVSTNIRTTADFGLTERVSLPGNRRDYYRFSEDAWHRGMEARIEGTTRLRRIAVGGLEALAPDDTAAGSHLRELIEFCDFMIVEHRAMIARWQASRALNRAKPPPGLSVTEGDE
jgi:hypothetical protein